MDLKRPAVDEEVDQELDFHLEMRRRQFLAAGMSDDDARKAALDRFGDYSRARSQMRALGHQREQRMRIRQYLSELRQDGAFAIRQLTAAPAFSLLAILTLAIGIGATTAIYSALHAIVLRPLGVYEPGRVVVITSTWRGGSMPVAPAHYLHLADEQKAFAAIAAMGWSNFALSREDGAERVIGARVTGRFFEVMGVQPALGRAFGPQEDVPGREGVAVISHRLWQRQFAGDPSIVGRDITMNQRPYTVVAVMPEGFDVTGQDQDVWVPFAFTSEMAARRGNHFLTVYARLADGVSVKQAAGQMPGIVRRRLEKWPDESAERALNVDPVMATLTGEYGQKLVVLFAAVMLVLLIACGNVSNLLLARGAARAREMALRSALGAGQGRLVRQLLTESVMLGAAGAAAGVALASWLAQLIAVYGPPSVPRIEHTRLDQQAVIFAAALALFSSLVFGLVPALRSSRASIVGALKEAGRGAGARGTRDIVRSTLIAGEVALALVLLVGAALLIRTAIEMQRVSAGFDPRGVYTGQVALGRKYLTPDAMLSFFSELEQRAASVPGVRRAAIASAVPGARGFSNGLLPEGKALSLDNITQSDGVIITPGYFETMRMPVVSGRAFTDADREGSLLVVMLNRTAVRMMWPGEDALGKRLTSANPLGPTTVVGIVEDVRLGGPVEDAPPTFYVPVAQMNAEALAGARAPYIVARTEGDPSALASSMRAAVAAADRDLPLYNVRTMEQWMANTVETARFNTTLLAMLGAAGLVLAAVGIYGVISYFASQRTPEMGLRMALGASRASVIALVVRQAMLPVLSGIVAGGIGAWFASKLIAAQLLDVTPHDPISFLSVAGGLLLVALLAAIVPARRAASLDPRAALGA